MSYGDQTKIERVTSPAKGSNLGVDLYLDKTTGQFYAHVNRKTISADTKDKAVKRIQAALAALTDVAWREVILLRVDADPKERDDDHEGTENGNSVYSTSCSFTYLRRERGIDPLKPKKTIEREHREEFEERVANARKNPGAYKHTKEAADLAERDLRDSRAAMGSVSEPYTYFGHRHGTKEYELPYSEEAWAGIRRIAQALRDTQAKLNAFARGATTEQLMQLATGDPMRLLSAGPKRNPQDSLKHKCGHCGKMTRDSTAGCDHCDVEDA
jgi:hypothetical protein